MSKTTAVVGLFVCSIILSASTVMLADGAPGRDQAADAKQAPPTGGAGPIGCKSVNVTRDLVSTAGEPSIVQASGHGLQGISWSPVGDKIRFTIQSFNAIPADASFLVCFSWKSSSSSMRSFVPADVEQHNLSSDGKQLDVTATVPDLGPKPSHVKKVALLWPVPLAEVRILATDNTNKVIANVPTEIGITNPLAALLLSGVAVIIGFVILYGVERPTSSGIQKAPWYLQAISTKDGFASLSQLQVLLWTFVVAVSALYVMFLSGRLVEITSGTLVLLGIAGATGVGAAIHNNGQINKAQSEAKAAADAAIDAQNAAAKAASAQAAAANQPAAANQSATNSTEVARLAEEATNKKQIAEEKKRIAERLKNPPDTQTPKWSDLLINQAITDTGVVTSEIDVTRFQMLLFTVVTAIFVLVTVITTYIIPEIPAGFVTLMGISNGVYLGSKITQS